MQGCIVTESGMSSFACGAYTTVGGVVLPWWGEILHVDTAKNDEMFLKTLAIDDYIYDFAPKEGYCSGFGAVVGMEPM